MRHVSSICLVISRVSLHTNPNEISIFSCNNVVYIEVGLGAINLIPMTSDTTFESQKASKRPVYTLRT